VIHKITLVCCSLFKVNIHEGAFFAQKSGGKIQNISDGAREKLKYQMGSIKKNQTRQRRREGSRWAKGLGLGGVLSISFTRQSKMLSQSFYLSYLVGAAMFSFYKNV